MKRTIRALVFLGILAVLFVSVTNLLQPQWIGETSTKPTLIYGGMKNLEDNDVELLVIGTSNMVYGFSCMYLEENYGIPAYSCATGAQPMLCSLYSLKEMDKHHNISTVLFDTSMLFGKEKEVRFRQTLDSVPRDILWLETVIEHQKSKKAEPFWSYVFTIAKYHSRWSELEEMDYSWKNTEDNCFRGNLMNGRLGTVSYDAICIDEKEADAEQEMAESPLGYFRQMAEYCKEQDINLVLLKTPTAKWDKTRMELCQLLAGEYGLDYIDFNTAEMLEALQIDTGQDFRDNHHLNVRGAEKLTDYLAEYLLERYEFTDIRQEESYDEEEVRRFYDKREDMYLTTSSDVSEMAAYLENEKYQVYAMEDGGSEVSGIESVKELLEGCGAVYDGSVFEKLQFQNKGLHLCVRNRETGETVDVSTVYRSGEAVKVKHKTL